MAETDITAQEEERTPRYRGSEQTEMVRKAAVSRAIRSQRELFRSHDRINIADLPALEQRTQSYLDGCEAAGLVPNLEGLAAMCGINRRWLYQYLDLHPDSPSARYIDGLRLAWTSLRASLAESKYLDPAVTFFLLKNSNLGFSDRQEIEVSQPAPPYTNVPEEVLKQRYLTDMAEDSDE